MNDVAILYICTGAYTVFWDSFYKSCESYFLPDCRKHYFVFTDAPFDEYRAYNNISIVKVECEKWPYSTLKRYHYFMSVKDQILENEFAFFFNANCEFVKTVYSDVFLKDCTSLMVFRHPGYYNKNNTEFPYDRNVASKAYIPMGKGKAYVLGGVNGGRSEAFLNMASEICNWVDEDEKAGVMAAWHDESMLNKYIFLHDDYKLLDSSYCVPEGWRMPFEPKIIIRDKSKWIDVDKIKGNKQRLIVSLVNRLRRMKRKVFLRDNSEMNVVDQKYWDKSYNNFDYYIAEDDVTKFIDFWIANFKTKKDISDCFEVGCFPGRYLAHVAKVNNLKANGVDITPELNESFLEWLRSNNVIIGDFYRGDAFTKIEELKKKRTTYDLVYSVGFVEHFRNYIDVINAHGQLLKKNGVMIITTPNFKGGFQRLAHYFLDRENYNRHVIDAMDPMTWKKEFENKGYRILFCGYFGRFDFWVDNQKRSFIQEKAIRMINIANPVMKHLLRHSKRMFAPYCGLVRVKTEE